MKVRVRRSRMPQMDLFGTGYRWAVWVGFENLAEFRHWADAVWFAQLVAFVMEKRKQANP